MPTRTVSGDSLQLQEGPLPSKGGELNELRQNGGILKAWNGSSWPALVTSATTLIGAINAEWGEPAGLAAVAAEELGLDVHLFPSGASAKLVAFLKVPDTYVATNQINLRVPHYSPSAANNILITATTYLVRKDTDAISATGNSHNAVNSGLVNTVANQYREALIDLTDGSGEVNSIAVSPGDILRIDLFRGVDTDTADIRVVSRSTEVNY